MNIPENGNHPPEEAMAGRHRLIFELFVDFDHLPGLTPESLFGLEEAIRGHLQGGPTPQEHEGFMHDIITELPGLNHIIKGTDNVTVLNLLTRIAKGETNLPINPLSSRRFVRTEDVLSAV